MIITKDTKKSMEENGFVAEELENIALQIAAVCFDKRILDNYKAKNNLPDLKENKK